MINKSEVLPDLKIVWLDEGRLNILYMFYRPFNNLVLLQVVGGVKNSILINIIVFGYE